MNVFWPSEAIGRGAPEFTRGGERLRMDDPGFAEALLRGPQRTASGVTPKARAYIGLTLAFVAALIAAAAYLVFRFAPAFLTNIVPVSWEERLGRATVAQMAPEPARCSDPQLAAAVESIAGRLEPRDSPYRFDVIVADDPAINAFAAPGGWIVVNRGLLRKTQSAEELAGVLAHEMQHVLQRHTTNGILRQLSWRAALALLLGDAGAADILYAAGVLRELSYQREAEESADREGLRMMRDARIDPAGMTAMLEMLEREATSTPQSMAYLSTHPDTAERRARIEALARAMRDAPEPLLTGVAWESVSARCR
jgi:predicted Zn-dependent protease